MVLDYSHHYGRDNRDGIVMDAIAIEKYHDMGNPDDPFYPEDYDGMPAIRIERQCGKFVKLLFYEKENRDKVYNNLADQIKQQR